MCVCVCVCERERERERERRRERERDTQRERARERERSEKIGETETGRDGGKGVSWARCFPSPNTLAICTLTCTLPHSQRLPVPRLVCSRSKPHAHLDMPHCQWASWPPHPPQQDLLLLLLLLQVVVFVPKINCCRLHHCLVRCAGAASHHSLYRMSDPLRTFS